MKEKIKELLAKTQAFGPGGETMDRYNCSLYDLEKFATLIIQDCAKASRPKGTHGIWRVSNRGGLLKDISE